MISVEAFLAKHPANPSREETAIGVAGEEGFGVSSGTETGMTAHGWARKRTIGTKPRTSRFGETTAQDGLSDDADADGTRNWGKRRSSWGRGKASAAPVEDPKDLDACREAALRLLDAAPRASGALRDRLVDKGYDPDVVEDVIERLTRVQLLDDRAYTESAVRYCAGRLMGRRAAVMELTRKGVERTLAEQVCAEAEVNGLFEEAAWELGRQIARKTQGLDPEVRRRRLWSTGGRKGHSPDVLRTIAQDLF